jgi:hypothetical protein
MLMLPPAYPQGLVPTSSHIASEGLQVGVPGPTHCGLVRGHLMLVQNPLILEALGIVAP